MTTTELRCDQNPSRLFAKLRSEGERPRIDPDSNLIEFACRDCRNAHQDRPKSVLHRYNLAGELVETLVIRGS